MFIILIGNNEINRAEYWETVYMFILSLEFREIYNKDHNDNKSITIVEYNNVSNQVINRSIYNNLSDFYMHRKSKYIEY
jgi:tricorn protease-like protein